MINIVDRANQKGILDKFKGVGSNQENNCFNCGIAGSIDSSNEKYCFKFNKRLTKENLLIGDYCIYYVSYIYDEDELLTPIQHLILKEDEVGKPVINLLTQSSI